jgi:hypothetical protein
VLAKIRLKQRTPLLKEIEIVTQVTFKTPCTPRSLIKVGKQLIRKKQLIKVVLIRYIKGAEF